MWWLPLVTMIWPLPLWAWFTLCCRLSPPDAMSMKYGWFVDNRDTSVLTRPHLYREWGLRCFGPRLLVGFCCEDTNHVESLDLSSSRCWTCLLKLGAWRAPSASLGGQIVWLSIEGILVTGTDKINERLSNWDTRTERLTHWWQVVSLTVKFFFHGEL
jgi:hypothetical protein